MSIYCMNCQDNPECEPCNRLEIIRLERIARDKILLEKKDCFKSLIIQQQPDFNNDKYLICTSDWVDITCLLKQESSIFKQVSISNKVEWFVFEENDVLKKINWQNINRLSYIKSQIVSQLKLIYGSDSSDTISWINVAEQLEWLDDLLSKYYLYRNQTIDQELKCRNTIKCQLIVELFYL